jgi:hypothetical protein
MFTTSTSFFIFYSSFIWDKELHPILHADFYRNDQIDDLWFFVQNIYYNIYTDYPHRIKPSNYDYFFAQKYNILISFSNRMKNEGTDWSNWFDCTPFILSSYLTVHSAFSTGQNRCVCVCIMIDSGILFYFISIIIVKSRRLERAQGPF